MVISWQLFVPVLCFQASSLKHMYFFLFFFFFRGWEARGCRLQTTWETACQRLGRECYSGRRGSNPICLGWSPRRGGSRLATQLCGNKRRVPVQFNERKNYPIFALNVFLIFCILAQTEIWFAFFFLCLSSADQEPFLKKKNLAYYNINHKEFFFFFRHTDDKKLSWGIK